MTEAKPLSDTEVEQIRAWLYVEPHTKAPKEPARIPKRLLATIDDLKRQIAGEAEQRSNLERALREKDHAMGILFKRLAKAGVDCSDLVP